jgi:putative flippase GtrA
MERTAANRRGELVAQMLRYGITGVGIALLYAGVYWFGADRLEVPPQMANGAGFSAALLAGYVCHSRWSFRGYGSRSGWSASRFLIVNIGGYLLNCFWVWVIVQHLGRPVELSIVPIVTLTPAFTFLFNRRWTFA